MRPHQTVKSHEVQTMSCARLDHLRIPRHAIPYVLLALLTGCGGEFSQGTLPRNQRLAGVVPDRSRPLPSRGVRGEGSPFAFVWLEHDGMRRITLLTMADSGA